MKDINKIEQEVSDILNDKVESNECNTESADLADYISRDLEEFGGVVEAEWTARNHSKVGDIDVKTGNGDIVHCELKVLSNTGRKGTLGNISQATFKEFKLFSNIKYSWKEHRRQNNNYKSKSIDILNQYDYYPDDIESMSNNTIKKRAAMGRHLRDVLDVPTGNKVKKIAEQKINHNERKVQEAAEIVIDVTELESKTRRDYINYLQSLNQNNTNIKKISILLLSGFKKQSHLEENWGGDIKNIKNTLEDKYRTYYCYESKVKNSSRARTIKELTKDKSFKFNFENNRSLYVSTENHKKILTFSLNWKNVFQGIKTDSINVFSEI